MTRKIKLSFSAVLIFLFILFSLGSARAREVDGLQVDVYSSVTETYDDNINLEDTDEQDDLITGVEAGVETSYTDELKSIILDASVTHEMFMDNNNLDNTSENLKFDYKSELSKRETLTLSDKFSHTYEPEATQEALGRTLGRYSYYTNDIVAEYIRDVSKQTQVKATYTNGIAAFASDSFYNSIGLEADHAVSSATTFLAAYEFSIRDFEEGDNATKNRIAAGIKQELTSQVSVEARAGMDYIDSYQGREYHKPMIYVALKDDLDSNTQFMVSLLKQYDLNAYEEEIFDQWGVFVSFTREPLKNFGYSGTLFYGDGKYVDSGLRDKYLGLAVKFFYKLTPKWKIIFGYEHSRVDSSDKSREYGDNKFFIGLRFAF